MIPENLLTCRILTLLATGFAALILSSCGAKFDAHNKVLVSVRDQKMMVLKDGVRVKTYPVSTSKYGLGDKPGSKYTPLGSMKIARKIGSGAPAGAVFKSRQRTGEVLRPNAPGRDPIVSRILWLKGNEYKNRNAYRRYIYIHGTPEERRIGRPASYGCIRMKSRDVIDLYHRVGVGAEVQIIRGSLFRTPQTPVQGYAAAGPRVAPVQQPRRTAGPAGLGG